MAGLNLKIKNKKQEMIFRDLAFANEIEIVPVKRSISSRNCDIIHGKIHLTKHALRSNFDIVFHELCHVLVVDPGYRKYMNRDTDESYRFINTKEKSKFNSESATMSLQHFLYKKFSLPSVSFRFGGSAIVPDHIHNYLTPGNIEDKWLERYEGILDRIDSSIDLDETLPPVKIEGNNFIDGSFFYAIENLSGPRSDVRLFRYQKEKWFDVVSKRYVKPEKLVCVAEIINR